MNEGTMMDNQIENEILQRLTGLEHAIKGNGVPGLRDIVKEQGRLLESTRNGQQFFVSKHELNELKQKMYNRLTLIEDSQKDLGEKLDQLLDRRKSKRENWKRLIEVWSLPSVLVLVQFILTRIGG